MLIVFNMLDGLARVQPKARGLSFLGGIKDFLKIHQTRNKSGALLLTMFDFTIRRGDERLTKGDAASAVQNAAPPARLAAHERSLRVGATVSVARTAFRRTPRPFRKIASQPVPVSRTPR